jgi:glycosyltransferase involved in cell wall biosynthesis
MIMINKLTIAIPIYNGEATLSDTLDSIIPQIIESGLVEILICDNCSTDSTYLICQSYVTKFNFIKYNLNAVNLGFDGNIARLIDLASTDYIWFLGDDDEIASGGIDYVLDLINQNVRYSGVVINYSIVNRGNNKIITEKVINQTQDLEFIDSNSLLNTLGLAPNFLSSIIINKKFYNKNELSKFDGLLWFHFIVFLRLIESGKSYFVSYPYILNKGNYVNGPNGANAGGVSIKIALDLLDHINDLNPLNYTQNVKKNIINDSLALFYRKVASARMHGAKISYSILKRLLLYYWKRPQLYIFILPLYFIPGFVYKVIYALRSIYRKILTN